MFRTASRSSGAPRDTSDRGGRPLLGADDGEGLRRPRLAGHDGLGPRMRADIPAWWKVHGDARNSSGTGRSGSRGRWRRLAQGLPVSQSSVGPADALRGRREGMAALRRRFAAQLAALPPETEAKVLLLAESPYAGGPAIAAPEGCLFEYPLAPRVGPGRLLDLLDRKGLWTDVEWNGKAPPRRSGVEGPARSPGGRTTPHLRLGSTTTGWPNGSVCRPRRSSARKTLRASRRSSGARPTRSGGPAGPAHSAGSPGCSLRRSRPARADRTPREGFLRTAARDDEVFVPRRGCRRTRPCRPRGSAGVPPGDLLR